MPDLPEVLLAHLQREARAARELTSTGEHEKQTPSSYPEVFGEIELQKLENNPMYRNRYAYSRVTKLDCAVFRSKTLRMTSKRYEKPSLVRNHQPCLGVGLLYLSFSDAVCGGTLPACAAR
jgi:hypothetical protein